MNQFQTSKNCNKCVFCNCEAIYKVKDINNTEKFTCYGCFVDIEVLECPEVSRSQQANIQYENYGFTDFFFPNEFLQIEENYSKIKPKSNRSDTNIINQKEKSNQRNDGGKNKDGIYNFDDWSFTTDRIYSKRKCMCSSSCTRTEKSNGEEGASNEQESHFISKNITFSKCDYSEDIVKKHSSIKKKEYKCLKCDLVLSRSDNLRYHVMRHFDYRPYKCNLCDTFFVNSSEIHKHMKKSHN